MQIERSLPLVLYAGGSSRTISIGRTGWGKAVEFMSWSEADSPQPQAGSPIEFPFGSVVPKPGAPLQTVTVPVSAPAPTSACWNVAVNWDPLAVRIVTCWPFRYVFVPTLAKVTT